MTRVRLRESYTPDVLSTVYPTPHDHLLYGRGHFERVEMMKDHALEIITNSSCIYDIADLSCGNAAVINSATEHARRVAGGHLVIPYRGDIALGYDYYGPIERTIEDIPRVDLFINGETLEHVENPDSVLQAIAAKTRWIILSTPTDNWEDTNAEHYWAWSEGDVSAMLEKAGFIITRMSVVDSRPWGEPYRFGIWSAYVLARGYQHGAL